MKKANRVVYGETLVKLANKYDFYVMDADLAKATGTKTFKEAFPNRFYDVGIAEGNLMATAAGLSSYGKPVFASTFAMFGAGRAYEQVRNSIAYPKANVKIVCSHGGVMIGEDGASHQCIEDLSLMRTIPNMTVLAPCDAFATEILLEKMILKNGPMYMRFGRRDVEVIYDENSKFEIGKGNKLASGTDGYIIACGEVVQDALAASKLLEKEGYSIGVIDMFTIKPIDTEIINECVKQTKRIFTIEDHNIIGGLGSAVAEVMSETGIGKLTRLGIKDRFGTSGKFDYLAEYFELSANKIAQNIKRYLDEEHSR